MSNPNDNLNPNQPASQQPAGFWARVWDKLQDAYDTIWVYCDPVTKVCYTHLSHHYEHKYRQKFPVHHSKVFYFDMFLLALLSFLLVAWFFVDAFLPLVPVPPLLRIDAVSPTAIVSGQETDFAYTFKNDSEENVNCPVLRIQLPAGAFMAQEIEDATSADRVCGAGAAGVGAGSEAAAGAGGSRLVWADESHRVLMYTLDAMAPKSTHNVRFIARVYGATGDLKPMAAELVYWESGALQASRVIARTEPAIASSALALDAVLPPTIQRGSQQVIAFTYKNVSEDVLNGAAVRVAPPEDFVITGASPAFGAAREWRLGTLAPSDFGTLTLYGYFRTVTGAASGAAAGAAAGWPAPTFTVRGYVATDESPNLLVEAKRFNADTRAADLVFTQEMISPRAGGVVPAGGTVQVAVHYRNDGEQTLKDLRITVDAGAPFVVATDAQGGTSVTVDSKTKSSLASIAPGESGTVNVSFTVKDTITAAELGALAYPALHVSSRGEYTIEEGAAGAGSSDGASSGAGAGAAAASKVRVDTGVADIAIASRLGFEAAALYYTKGGDQLGVGPLPPTVGQETKYRVFLTVSATTSAVGNAIVEATLPEGVRYAGGASVNNGSAIDYLPSLRKIRWEVGTIPAFSDADTVRIGATFEVAVTPTAEQVGTAPLLLTGLAAHGRDAATAFNLNAKAGDLTTDLPFDVRAAGKGAVIGGVGP